MLQNNVVKLITISSDDSEVVAHNMPSVTIIHAGKVDNIQDKMNLGNATNKIPMLFRTKETVI